MTDNDLCDKLMTVIGISLARGMSVKDVQGALEMVRDIMADQEAEPREDADVLPSFPK